jgi:hypothetical protein
MASVFPEGPTLMKHVDAGEPHFEPYVHAE